MVDDGVDVRKYTLRDRCMYVSDEGWSVNACFEPGSAASLCVRV